MEFFDGGAVGLGEFTAGWHRTVEILLGELQGAVDEVAVDGHQFVVVACLEISPRKVVVLGFGGVGGQYISHDVLFAREVVEVFVEPHCPVAGSANLVVL